MGQMAAAVRELVAEADPFLFHEYNKSLGGWHIHNLINQLT
jgi:hypothetical protein